MGTYLMRVIAAGVLCCIVRQLFDNKSAASSAVRLLSGVFMTLVIVAPILEIRIDSVFYDIEQLKANGEYAAQEGDNYAKEAMAEIIIDKTQAYILDKAKSLGAEVRVTLELTDEMPPKPCGVEIMGKVSPYAKNVLSQYLETDLGICKEAQRWIG